MLRRAVAMRSALRARQQGCEAAGRILEETHSDFLRSGFYRILQPRRYGGYEFSLADLVRLLVEVSRGCTDSGWVLSLIAAQPASVLCLFPEQAQSEVYGDAGDCRVAAVIAAGGSATITTAGYRVSGQWDYCTGCDIATHFLGTAILLHPLTGAPYGTACVLLNREQLKIVDNWRMIGMQGTGSRRVVAGEVTIPEHRVLPLSGSQWRDPGTQPGHAVHSNPLYHGSPLTAAEFALDAVAVGAARGALDAFEDILRKKWPLPPYAPRFEMPEFQQTFGTAQALVDAAEASLTGLAERCSGQCPVGQELAGLPLGEDLRRILRAGAQCVEMAWQATDLMFRSAGSSAGTQQSPLGRCFRGLAVLRTHIAVQYEQKSVNVARLHFGLPDASTI
jgi:3-hydroxy-9,10-secoandrosta-1,3,5(10)-triene-9,17-dione monooxygenase